MITLNGVLPIDAGQQWVFVTLTADGDECKFTHVAPADLTGQDLQEYVDVWEEAYRIDILKDMYPGAIIPVIGGNTPIQDFEAWVADTREESTTSLITPGTYDQETNEQLTPPVFETTSVTGPANVITTVTTVLDEYGKPEIATPAVYHLETGELLTEAIYKTVSETTITIIEKIPWAGKHPDHLYQISVLGFRKRLTLEEKIAIHTSTDPIVKIFLADLSAAQYVDFRDKDLVDGINYITLLNLITNTRAQEILSIT